MSDLRNHPVVITAKSRDEKAFFGQGWSHYGRDFEFTMDGLQYGLQAWNMPHHIQINWFVDRVGSEIGDPNNLVVALTPEESRALASEIGLPIEDWLREALAACDRDVTPDVVARSGEMVDPVVFHSGRAGDDI